MSTNTTISALSGLTWNARMTASARPSASPVMTTASAISMVVTTPFRIDGRYCAIRFGLKKVSRKAFTAAHGSHRVSSAMNAFVASVASFGAPKICSGGPSSTISP